MYTPLIKAFNYSLDRLSKVDVTGLPKFEEEHQIVFVPSDAKYIGTETYLQGSYKPDIILIKWNKFKAEYGSKNKNQPYSESYRLPMRGKSGRSSLSWRNILSTVEVKRDDSGGAGSKDKAMERSVKPKYTGGFGDLQDREVVGSSSSKLPQSAPQKMVDEEYSTRRCMSTALLFSSHSHQVQSEHALAREVKVSHLRPRIGRYHPKRGAENSTKPQKLPRRGPRAMEPQNLVGPANRGRNRTNQRQKSRRNRKSKHRKFRVQSTHARRFHPLSTSPIQ